jgi:hypothetical protein
VLRSIGCFAAGAAGASAIRKEHGGSQQGAFASLLDQSPGRDPHAGKRISGRSPHEMPLCGQKHWSRVCEPIAKPVTHRYI